MKGAGPFDPARPATLLANGVVDAGDAPMPAARVDVSIAPNSGGASIDGVGALEKADKAIVYSRDGNGFDPRLPHNLDAPYYQQYIPATSAPGLDSSGIDGPQTGNTFPGFLVDGLYDNWDIAAVLRSNPWADTTCNRYVDFGASLDDGWYPRDTPRNLPYGPQKVAVYTDEHGEAQVEYEPYSGGFYYDNLPVIHNANRGCDLQGIDVLGTSDITATAQYPYQPVSDGPKVSAALHKVVHSQFNKALSYWPKGDGVENQNARIAVVHANDVDGSPFAHELVCFYVAEQADGVRGFVGDVGPAGAAVHIGGDTVRNTVQGADVCRRLDQNGNAAIEVFNSDPQTINVIAEFANEGLLRSIDLDFATPGSHSGMPPVTTPPSDNDHCRRDPSWSGCPKGDGAGTKAPSAAQLAETAGAPAASHLKRSLKKTKQATRRVAVARISLRQGKHVLFVRVRSSRKHERIMVRLGKQSLRRTIATNHLVRIADVPEGVVVTVTIVG